MTHLVSSTGTLAYEYSFDAWGRLRDPVSRQVYEPDSEPTLFLDRGYTGHEHLPLFDVINMNARLYDPAIGRFLSPDPFVQASDFSQNYNRYSYCMNNPLVYKDKNGEWANIVIGAIIGGFTNLMMNIDNVDNAGQFFGYFGVGAAAGALGGWAGGAVSSALGAASTFGGAIANGALSGGAAGLSSGFVGGAGNAWIGGANFGQGLHAGINSGAIGALSGALTGGVAGGIRYQRQNFIFRKSLSELGVNAEDAVPATDDFLNRA